MSNSDSVPVDFNNHVEHHHIHQLLQDSAEQKRQQTRNNHNNNYNFEQQQTPSSTIMEYVTVPIDSTTTPAAATDGDPPAPPPTDPGSGETQQDKDKDVPTTGGTAAKFDMTYEDDEGDIGGNGGEDEGFFNSSDNYDDDDSDRDPTEVMIATQINDFGLPGPPDGGWGWVIVFSSFLINLVMDGVTSSFGVLLPQIVDEYNGVSHSHNNHTTGNMTTNTTTNATSSKHHVGHGDVAWAGSILCGVSLFIGPVISALTNKFGCRPVCMVGAVISCAAFIGAAYSPGLEMLLLTYGLFGGIGFGLLYLPAIVCVSYYFEKRRSLATGLAVSGSGLGSIIFAPVITSMNATLDWKQVCLGYAIMLGLLIFAAASMKSLKIKVEEVKPEELKKLLAEEDKKQGAAATTDKEGSLYASSGLAIGSGSIGSGGSEREILIHEGSGGTADPATTSGGTTGYYRVYLPDGTVETRFKKKNSLNIDPGVQSGINLDQLFIDTEELSPTPTATSEKPIVLPASVSTELITPVVVPPNIDILPTITEHGDKISDTLLQRLSLIESEEGQGSSSDQAATNNDVDDNETPGASKSKQRMATEAARILLNQTGVGRERRVSEGESDALPQASPALVSSSYGGRERSGTEVRKTSTRGGKGRGRAGSKDSALQAASSDTGLGVESGTTPGTRRRSSLRMPSVASGGQRNDSFISSRRSLSKRGSQADDDDQKLLLNTNEFSQLLHRTSSTQGASASSEKIIIRPMSRKDVFYSGSITKLPEFQSQNLVSYRQSILNIPRKAAEEDDKIHKLRAKLAAICPCIRKKTGAFISALKQMMDFSLVKHPKFLPIGISGLVGMLGFYVPTVYAIEFGKSKGIDEEKSAWLISIIGITSTIGRVSFGLLSDIKGVDSFLVYNICIFVMGVATLCMPLVPPGMYALLAVLYTIFGLSVSGFVALSSIILVQLLGLENLTNAFGLLIFFRGFSTVLGTPLAGAIRDMTGSYDLPFYLAGVFLLISGVISVVGSKFAVYIVERNAKLAAAIADEQKLAEAGEGGVEGAAAATSGVGGGAGLADILEVETSSSSSSSSTPDLKKQAAPKPKDPVA